MKYALMALVIFMLCAFGMVEIRGDVQFIAVGCFILILVRWLIQLGMDGFK